MILIENKFFLKIVYLLILNVFSGHFWLPHISAFWHLLNETIQTRLIRTFLKYFPFQSLKIFLEDTTVDGVAVEIGTFMVLWNALMKQQKFDIKLLEYFVKSGFQILH